MQRRHVDVNAGGKAICTLFCIYCKHTNVPFSKLNKVKKWTKNGKNSGPSPGRWN